MPDPGAAADDTIALNAREAAEVTGGHWSNLDDPAMTFTGVTLGGEIRPGELCVTQNSAQWGQAVPDTETRIESFHQRGAVAFVVRENSELTTALPLLRVPDTREALRRLAEENRRRTDARRVLVTGTEGKTGLKVMLHHVIRDQAPVHATLDSANLHAPIWRSLASIRRGDRFAIVEASVAQPGRAVPRSRFIRPQVCVITNISPQHTHYHGSVHALVRNKADAVKGLEPGGVAILNADNAYFHELKEAVQRRRAVPVLTFGSGPACDGRLLCADYVAARAGWRVHARILGRDLSFFIHMVNSYAPLAAVSALLVTAYLGLDPERAAASLAGFEAYETAGHIRRLPVGDGHFTLFDHSHRGSIAGFRSAFDDLYRLAGDRRIIVVLGAVLELAEADERAVHEELAGLIDPARVDRVFTVGGALQYTRDAIAESGLLADHGEHYRDIEAGLFAAIRPGDVVLVKGHHRVWLSRLVEDMEARFGAAEHETPTRAGVAESDRAALHTLVAGGDVMLGRDLPARVAVEGPEWAFGETAALLHDADIALANLECVVTTGGSFMHKGERRPYYYRCRPELTDVLVENGLSVVTTANNHAMDFGPDALAEQAGLLAACGLAAPGSGAGPGAAAEPAFVDAGGLTVAVLAFETESPELAAAGRRWGICHVGRGAEAVRRLAPAVARGRAHADLVIASPHWGANWAERPGTETRTLARELIALGVDAVLGHSAHVLQGVEVCGGRPIVYDMGTLLFDRVQEGRMRYSALFELGFDAGGVRTLTVHPVRLYRSRVRPAEGMDAERVRELIRHLSGEFDPDLAWREEGGRLHLALEPAPRQPRPAPPDRRYRKAARVPLGPAERARPDGTVLDAPPAPLADAPGVALGGGLEVLGVGYPESVRPGRGFVFAIAFRCPETGGRRWRAALEGRPGHGEPFQYRHPVADGMWVPQRWAGDGVIVSRVVIRPPADLAPGNYRLFWRLYDGDSGEPWPVAADATAGVHDGWLDVGAIEMTREAPRGVAGVAWARDVEWRPLGRGR